MFGPLPSICRSVRVVAAVCAFAMSASIARSDVFNMGGGAKSLTFVPVGNAGNSPDPLTGFGQVNYNYNMGKYDVTQGQYTAFLNAVAVTDTYGVYSVGNANMLTPGFSGITRIGSNGSYSYSVDPAFANRPINGVTFWDCCRFANWLQNGQPVGLQGPGTTETGAYTLTASGMAANTITRNAGATYAVPTQDEWYKAAFFNPVTSNYFLFPTSSDTAPGNSLADPLGNNANYLSAPVPIDPPYYTTIVGQFQNSPSPYATFDQGGNVFQWNETVILGTYRGIRGGQFGADASWMRADVPLFVGSDPGYGHNMTNEDYSVGFRVMQVPEPASLVLLSISCSTLLRHRRRKI